MTKSEFMIAKAKMCRDRDYECKECPISPDKVGKIICAADGGYNIEEVVKVVEEYNKALPQVKVIHQKLVDLDDVIEIIMNSIADLEYNTEKEELIEKIKQLPIKQIKIKKERAK